MGKWQPVKLNDCCASISDGDHQAPPKSTSGIPFVTISNIDSYNSLDFSNVMYVPQEYYDKLDNKRKAQPGDIIYSVVGSFGIPVLIKNDIPFVFQRHIAILKPNNTIDSRFLYYSMLSKDFYHKADAVAIGAAQRTISLTALRNLEISLPPLEVQRKIADILSAYDDLIENNRKQIKLLEEAAQRLYKEWFIDLRFPGYETTPIVNGVPDGWKKVQLRELIAFNPKIAVTIDTIKTFVPMEALSTSSMVISASEVFETSKNAGSKFEIGDTLLARITPCLENGKTAFVSNIDKGGYGVGSTEFIVLRSEKLNPYIVYLLARTKEFRSYAINSMTGSDGRQRVKVDKLEKYPTLLPSRKVIDLFGRIVAPYFGKVKVLSKAIHSCQEARNYLLPKLMTGELEVEK